MRYNNDRRYYRGNPRESGRPNSRSARQPFYGGQPAPPNYSYRQDEPPEPQPEDIPDPTETGSEANYWRTLIDTKRLVTILLKTGERLRGQIRYYDRNMLSLGQADGGPNLFLPKHSVVQVIED